MMFKRSDNGAKKKKRLGIRWRIFIYLAVFIALMVLIVWFFQVRLLNYFYKDIKLEEFERATEQIRESITPATDAELDSLVLDTARGSDICIRVFHIRGNVMTEVGGADILAGCVIHHVSKRDITDFYYKCHNREGLYIAEISFDKKMTVTEIEGNSIIDAFEKPKENVSLLYVRLIRDSAGNAYMVLLNSEMLPLRSTVNTLTRQFLWIAIVFLVGAVALAFIISSKITKPLRKINEAAKDFASGNREADFSVKGYRETDELADTLNFAAREIKVSEELQKELIANVSHDLRTPLTMIKGYGEVMRDIPGENTPENVQVIIDETAHLSDMVSDMLDISKIHSGAQKPEMEVFSLTDTVRDVLSRYEKLIEHDGYTIEFTASDEIYVSADRGMMLQVLYNLINNAINYTGEDKRVTLTQTHDEKKNVVRISVTDSGEGIERNDLDSVWDRYYKVDKVHKRAKIGTGLGLSIVKRIFDMHSMSYGIDSTLGVGTTFWFEMRVENKEN